MDNLDIFIDSFSIKPNIHQLYETILECHNNFDNFDLINDTLLESLKKYLHTSQCKCVKTLFDKIKNVIIFSDYTILYNNKYYCYNIDETYSIIDVCFTLNRCNVIYHLYHYTKKINVKDLVTHEYLFNMFRIGTEINDFNGLKILINNPLLKINQCIKYTINEKNSKVTQMLLTNNILNIDIINYTIKHASRNGLIEIVKLLLNDSRFIQIVDPASENNYAIRWASENGHLEVVELLLGDHRVDPADNNNFAIRWASEYGHLKVVKLLLEDKRVDPADNDNAAIAVASRNGHLEVVKLLLDDQRVNPADNDNAAIRFASYHGHIEVVKLLLQDSRVKVTRYAIEYAAQKNHIEIVLYLLSKNIKCLSYITFYKNVQELLKNLKYIHINIDGSIHNTFHYNQYPSIIFNTNTTNEMEVIQMFDKTSLDKFIQCSSKKILYYTIDPQEQYIIAKILKIYNIDCKLEFLTDNHTENYNKIMNF
jgi:ankyrin repeat protein